VDAIQYNREKLIMKDDIKMLYRVINKI